MAQRTFIEGDPPGTVRVVGSVASLPYAHGFLRGIVL